MGKVGEMVRAVRGLESVAALVCAAAPVPVRAVVLLKKRESGQRMGTKGLERVQAQSNPVLHVPTASRALAARELTHAHAKQLILAQQRLTYTLAQKRTRHRAPFLITAWSLASVAQFKKMITCISVYTGFWVGFGPRCRGE